MAGEDLGSLTKEPPLAKLDATIRAIRPGMPYRDLLAFARKHTHKDAPGLLRNRFLLVRNDESIAYDHFLSLAAAHGLGNIFIRKIMYFLWAYRDKRIRQFVCEKIADKSGLWHSSEIINKGNAKFFEAWVQPSTARKARSNFEFFLTETKIFRPKSRTVHLELDDGWLTEAAIAAAQHEQDVGMREALLADPKMFLENLGWLGLLNATLGTVPPTFPTLSADSTPLEDEGIDSKPSNLATENDWKRASPTSSGRTTAIVNIDLVTRERANKSHYELEKLLFDTATAEGIKAKHNKHIDMYFGIDERTVLIEVKSCTDSNFHSQFRKGVSQLFEYRFLYKDIFAPDVVLLLLMETRPPKEKTWLVDYANSIGVILAWKDVTSARITSTSPLQSTLSKIVTKAKS